MCARHGRGAIEICLSEKGALAKKILGNTGLATRGSVNCNALMSCHFFYWVDEGIRSVQL